MKNNRKKYIEAANKFVEIEKSKKDTLGIILAGSAIYSRIDKNSDVDVHIILHPECDYRERGNTWIDGLEIEYFKNPPVQVRAYFEEEKGSPHTAHMLAHGRVVYGKSEIIKKLQIEAINLINKKPNKIKNFELELLKYALDDLYKDLEDASLNQDSLGVGLIRGRIVDECISAFCKIHRIRREKDKRLSSQLMGINPHYFKLLEACVKKTREGDSDMNQLREATEEFLGGRRAKEWKLRSELDI